MDFVTVRRTYQFLSLLTGVSSSTLRRTLNEFEDRLWIRQDGYQYVATRLGEAIAYGTEDLLDRVESAAGRQRLVAG